ncbi:MAG: PH domain-containing protein [Slackia sp.]
MRPLPKNQLDPKVKNVWRISDALWLTVVYAACSVTFFIIALVDSEASWAWIVVAAMTAAWLVALVVMVGILPPVRHIRWRYEVGENELDISRGIIWRVRFVIPFVRVQNTDTKQGPILRMFDLASVTVSTAAGETSFPALLSKRRTCCAMHCHPGAPRAGGRVAMMSENPQSKPSHP